MKSSKLPPSKSTIAKGDSGASNHYFALHDADAPIHQQPSKGTVVTLPDSKSLSSNVQAELPLSSNLSPTAKQVELFPHLNHNLISLGQLCDDKCVVLLDKDKLLALKMQKITIKGGTVKLEGKRSTSGDKLWDIPIPQKARTNVPVPSPRSMNVIIRKEQTKYDLVVYLHAACFLPSPRTFIDAIKKFFSPPGQA